tara:strand:+ start:322 stop:600 length:279 start_codon:yes stop_codon:yes gene_type:complete
MTTLTDDLYKDIMDIFADNEKLEVIISPLRCEVQDEQENIKSLITTQSVERISRLNEQLDVKIDYLSTLEKEYENNMMKSQALYSDYCDLFG